MEYLVLSQSALLLIHVPVRQGGCMWHGSVHTGLFNCFHKDGEKLNHHPKYEVFSYILNEIT